LLSKAFPALEMAPFLNSLIALSILALSPFCRLSSLFVSLLRAYVAAAC
jgi:hypothetical protein